MMIHRRQLVMAVLGAVCVHCALMIGTAAQVLHDSPQGSSALSSHLQQRRQNQSTGLLLKNAFPAPSSTLKLPGWESKATSSPEQQRAFQLALGGHFFVPNHGQWSDSSVHFGRQSDGWSVAMKTDAIQIILRRAQDTSAIGPERADVAALPAPHPPMSFRIDDQESPMPQQFIDETAVTLSFPGSNHGVIPIGINPTPTRVNYFVGGKNRRSAAGLETFGAVEYPNLYDGIDLYIKGNEKDGTLKYEFHVASGADPAQIRMHYDGLDCPLHIDAASGNLQIETNLGTLVDHTPLAYHPASTQTQKQPVAVTYQLSPDHDCRFSFADGYDNTRELVIDPEVLWMKYLGGRDYDGTRHGGIALNSDGSLWVAGVTSSINFTGRINGYFGGVSDAFLCKLAPDGTTLWMTYFGGSGSEGYYLWCEVASDSQGNAFITGATGSTDIPNANNSSHGPDDAYVCKIDGSGMLQWSTYLGGSDIDRGMAITVDPSGSIFVAGETESVDFEGSSNSMHGGDSDAFVCKVSASGHEQWMNYLGGAATDWGYGMALSHTGSVIIAGYTDSEDFEGRVNNGGGYYYDAFACAVSDSGNVQWMTYLKGSDDSDFGNAVICDKSGNSLITGTTWSDSFDGQLNSKHGDHYSSDGFLCKVTPSGSVLWSLYIGGSFSDFGNALCLDNDGNVIVAGSTSSRDLDGRTNDGNGNDAFCSKVSPDGNLIWSSYLGGRGNDEGYATVVDSQGSIYVAGRTLSDRFSGRINNNHGYIDSFVLKLNTSPNAPSLSISPMPLQSGQDGNFTAIQLTPYTVAYLVYSLRGLGTSFFQPLNVTLDLAQPKQVGTVMVTDSNGSAQWTLHVPSVSHPVDIWFQACQYQNKTNVVAARIVP